jgi:hypothetical protein
MIRILLPVVLCVATLAACSSEPQRNGTQASAPAASTAGDAAPVSGPMATPTVVRDWGAKPVPGGLKTFGDWGAGCDNTKACEMRSLAPEGQLPGGVTVSIGREAGPAGAVSFSLGGEQDGLAASVDGKTAATPLALVTAMANGRALAALAAGKVVGTVSLKGAAAALRYMDAEQGRAGTTSALVAKGPAPAETTPPPVVPVIAALTPDGTAASASAAQLATMRKAANCDAEGSSDTPEFHALGGGRTLVLLPCSGGAYNISQALFVSDGSGFAPAQTDAPVGTGPEGESPVPTVVNGRWEKDVLTSYAKGRGMGDCGVSQELVWDGTRLRLSLQREMGECRGNMDYIRTWQARVVRR